MGQDPNFDPILTHLPGGVAPSKWAHQIPNTILRISRKMARASPQGNTLPLEARTPQQQSFIFQYLFQNIEGREFSKFRKSSKVEKFRNLQKNYKVENFQNLEKIYKVENFQKSEKFSKLTFLLDIWCDRHTHRHTHTDTHTERQSYIGAQST